MDSTPVPHAVIHGQQLALRLRFNSRVDGPHSRLYLENAGVKRLIKIAAQPSPDTLIGNVGSLIPGAAVLRWQVLAVDGHISRGELPFEVK
jgi:methionine-rich copper-binding protein CopC